MSKYIFQRRHVIVHTFLTIKNIKDGSYQPIFSVISNFIYPRRQY